MLCIKLFLYVYAIIERPEISYYFYKKKVNSKYKHSIRLAAQARYLQRSCWYISKFFSQKLTYWELTGWNFHATLNFRKHLTSGFLICDKNRKTKGISKFETFLQGWPPYDFYQKLVWNECSLRWDMFLFSYITSTDKKLSN